MSDERLSEDELTGVEERANQLLGGTWYNLNPRLILKCTAEIRRLRTEVENLSAELLPFITPRTDELCRIAEENPPAPEWFDEDGDT